MGIMHGCRYQGVYIEGSNVSNIEKILNSKFSPSYILATLCISDIFLQAFIYVLCIYLTQQQTIKLKLRS